MLKSIRHLTSFCLGLALALGLLCSGTVAQSSPTVEFDIPLRMSVLAGGTVLELSGSFGWSLPQSFQAILAASPQVRVIRFASPGGHVAPALEVAAIIQQRGLDTYVDRYCASACTVAFLGGLHRWIGPNGRLGFHQARAPGFPAEQANAFLQMAYQKLGVPAPFIAHALRTVDLWYPTPDELQAAHFTTGAPPASVVALGSNPFPRLTDLSRMLPAVQDDITLQFATTLMGLIGQLQEASPEACWSFAHEYLDDPQIVLPNSVLNAIDAAKKRLTDAPTATHVTMLDPEQRKKITADLLNAIRTNGHVAELDGLRQGADHAAFCPSLRVLLQAALELPGSERVAGLRAVLSSW